MTEQTQPELTLYMRDFCMYCNRVMRAIDEQGLNVKIRNIWDDKEDEKALVAGTGRRSVPVLRIQKNDQITWMPESTDIIHYLTTEIAQPDRV